MEPSRSQSCGRPPQPQPWTSEPIKVIQIHGELLLAGEGSNVLIWSLDSPDDPPQVVKVFIEEWPITSISCASCGKAEIHILITSLYSYRKIVLDSNTKKLKIRVYPVLEARCGEILAGHCFDSGEFILYDLNNYAMLHELDAEGGEERVSIFEGHLGAPDSVSLAGNSKNDVLIFVATSSRVSLCKLKIKSNPDRKEVHHFYTFCQAKVSFLLLIFWIHDFGFHGRTFLTCFVFIPGCHFLRQLLPRVQTYHYHL